MTRGERPGVSFVIMLTYPHICILFLDLSYAIYLDSSLPYPSLAYVYLCMLIHQTFAAGPTLDPILGAHSYDGGHVTVRAQCELLNCKGILLFLALY
ncbi:hypothetical protein DEU56DRAFT_852652 [Suillus clintonianus]|uniref:uncharacterized protein n=1 Tax=Suillus clintonianus TaxID=1904413 RepID=UPI001B87B8D5|nr:uncharacterized protein DEU56DRAFT_852652 [Suillus clintonianus]KAG2147635.1 hypothetical protein DEU56DRAFT_852652 [Suillus clintonianus]